MKHQAPTLEQLRSQIAVLIAHYDYYNTPIDSDKYLTFIVIEFESYYKVEFNYISSVDPDGKETQLDTWFKWLKSEPYGKLFGYIEECLDEVVKNKVEYK